MNTFSGMVVRPTLMNVVCGGICQTRDDDSVGFFHGRHQHKRNLAGRIFTQRLYPTICGYVYQDEFHVTKNFSSFIDYV